MGDGVNPYASPTAVSGERRVVREPPRPWVTRGVAVGLGLNFLAIPLLMAMETSADMLRRNGGPRFLVDGLEGGCEWILFWIMFAWPIVSLVALRYTAFPDRHTKWWRTKTVIAALMLILGVMGSGTLIWFLYFTEQ